MTNKALALARALCFEYFFGKLIPAPHEDSREEGNMKKTSFDKCIEGHFKNGSFILGPEKPGSSFKSPLMLAPEFFAIGEFAQSSAASIFYKFSAWKGDLLTFTIQLESSSNGCVVDLDLLDESKSVLKNSVFLSTGGNQCRCCLLYTSPSPRDATLSRMPSSA